MRRKLVALAAALVLGLSTQAARAWSHQGHILITRMACLRIINDDKAPAEFRAFLKANMKYDMEACRKLVETEFVGIDAKNYLTGLDGACTLPDRIQQMDEGDKIIDPYGEKETKMHFLDMEYFAKEAVYKGDLSNRPAIKDFPKDPKDARYKSAGFVPFRVEEFYGKLVKDFAKQQEFNETQAVHDLGYLAHYIEDCTQPHHATIDYKSFSYLAGKVNAVKATTKTNAEGKQYAGYQVTGGAKINPHGDLEFQLFENTDEPRKSLRQQLWKELNAQIDSQAKARDAAASPAAPFDGFNKSLSILSKSYEHLPAVGEAALAAYAKDAFDAKAFFTHEVTLDGKKTDIIGLIARQKATAVLELEAAIRAAWAEAHPK